MRRCWAWCGHNGLVGVGAGWVVVVVGSAGAAVERHAGWVLTTGTSARWQALHWALAHGARPAPGGRWFRRAWGAWRGHLGWRGSLVERRQQGARLGDEGLGTAPGGVAFGGVESVRGIGGADPCAALLRAGAGAGATVHAAAAVVHCGCLAGTEGAGFCAAPWGEGGVAARVAVETPPGGGGRSYRAEKAMANPPLRRASSSGSLHWRPLVACCWRRSGRKPTSSSPTATTPACSTRSRPPSWVPLRSEAPARSLSRYPAGLKAAKVSPNAAQFAADREMPG